jgi:hypothetical protein
MVAVPKVCLKYIMRKAKAIEVVVMRVAMKTRLEWIVSHKLIRLDFMLVVNQNWVVATKKIPEIEDSRSPIVRFICIRRLFAIFRNKGFLSRLDWSLLVLSGGSLFLPLRN